MCESHAQRMRVGSSETGGGEGLTPNPKSLQRDEVNVESFMQRAFFVFSRNVIAINFSVSYLIVKYDHESLVYIQKQPFSMMIHVGY